MASRQEGYWAHSHALLMHDRGWIKPLLVLGAVRLLPVIGDIGADGYALEWARLTAWGVDSSPKQRDVQVGTCIKSGARAFVISLGYGLIWAIVASILSRLLSDAAYDLVSMVISVFGAVLIMVAQLRGAIYQSVGAGFGIVRICDMVKRDYHGLLRVTGMFAVLMAMFSMVIGAAATALLFVHAREIMEFFMAVESSSYVDEWFVVRGLLNGLASVMPIVMVLSYFFNVFRSYLDLVEMTAVGLWMRQFDIAHWGNSSDPLPTTVAGGTVSGASADAAKSVPAQEEPDDVIVARAVADENGDSMWSEVDIPVSQDVPMEIETDEISGDGFADSAASEEFEDVIATEASADDSIPQEFQSEFDAIYAEVTSAAHFRRKDSAEDTPVEAEDEESEAEEVTDQADELSEASEEPMPAEEADEQQETSEPELPESDIDESDIDSAAVDEEADEVDDEGADEVVDTADEPLDGMAENVTELVAEPQGDDFQDDLNEPIVTNPFADAVKSWSSIADDLSEAAGLDATMPGDDNAANALDE